MIRYFLSFFRSKDSSVIKDENPKPLVETAVVEKHDSSTNAETINNKKRKHSDNGDSKQIRCCEPKSKPTSHIHQKCGLCGYICTQHHFIDQPHKRCMDCTKRQDSTVRCSSGDHKTDCWKTEMFPTVVRNCVCATNHDTNVTNGHCWIRPGDVLDVFPSSTSSRHQLVEPCVKQVTIHQQDTVVASTPFVRKDCPQEREEVVLSSSNYSAIQEQPVLKRARTNECYEPNHTPPPPTHTQISSNHSINDIESMSVFHDHNRDDVSENELENYNCSSFVYDTSDEDDSDGQQSIVYDEDVNEGKDRAFSPVLEFIQDPSKVISSFLKSDFSCFSLSLSLSIFLFFFIGLI